MVSFSENGDLLDQWRAYGDNGEGYSLGIEPHKVALEKSKSIFTDEESIAFVRVIYNEDKQMERIREAIDTVYPILKDFLALALDDKMRKAVSSTVAQYLSSMIFQLTCFYKHPAFENEREWRVVRIKWGRKSLMGSSMLRKTPLDPVSSLFYRPSGKILAPYVKLNFQQESPSGFLPLKEIILGPKHKNRRIPATNSLEMQLMTLGYDDNNVMPEIRISNIPYQ